MTVCLCLGERRGRRGEGGLAPAQSGAPASLAVFRSFSFRSDSIPLCATARWNRPAGSYSVRF